MSDESTILQALLDLKSDTGALLAGQEAANKLFEQHVVEDRALAERVTAIEGAQNQRKGARKVLTALAHGVTGVAGVVVGTVVKRYFGH